MDNSSVEGKALISSDDSERRSFSIFLLAVLDVGEVIVDDEVCGKLALDLRSMWMVDVKAQFRPPKIGRRLW